MVVAVVSSQLLPVVVTIATVAVITYALVLCVCGKRKKNEDPELTNVKAKHASTVIPPEALAQGDTSDITAVHLEVETAVTPLNNTQNGTLHKRGESLDLSKTERNSQTSCGSSPRPSAISRELPEIPFVSKTQTLSQESSAKGGHHDRLPDIPTSGRSPVSHRTKSPTAPLSTVVPVGATARKSSAPGDRTKSVADRDSKSKSGDEFDDYDHLDETKQKKFNRRSDYDHVVLADGKEQLIPAKTHNNDYAEVKSENIYEGVADDDDDVTVIDVSGSRKKESKEGPAKAKVDDPYNTVPDDDPYNKIKVDDPYSKIKKDYDPYNKISGDDPYNKVKDDDPYNKVTGDEYEDVVPSGKVPKRAFKRSVGEDPYNLVNDDERDVSNQSSQITDPYSRVIDDISEIDDPYNKVLDDLEESSIGAVGAVVPMTTDDDYATVNKRKEEEMDVEYAQVNKQRRPAAGNQDNGHPDNSAAGNNSALGSRSTSNTSVEIVHDEYATVVKVRKIPDQSANTQSSSAMNAVSPLTPPEPPRAYQMEDSRSSMGHYNTVLLQQSQQQDTADQSAPVAPVAQSPEDSGPEGASAAPSEPVRKKEPPYTKLTARESLASMNARIANNPYELVPETDNLYATVEGGSGDGVIRSRTSQHPPVARDSVTSEYYTEIGEGAAAPAPPSLDSLHETAKNHQVEFRRKTDHRPGDLCHYSNMDEDPTLGHQRTPSGHFRMPSGDTATGPLNGMVAMVPDSPSVDPDYQSVVDRALDPDAASEFDPNYETVDEAKSRVKYEEIKDDEKKVAEKKLRLHVYEEVTVTNEAKRTKQRVLSQHTYEDITEVKGQKGARGQAEGASGTGQSSSEIQKRNSGHQRKSSSESSKILKRKSGELKDKGKDKRKSSEGKDSLRKSGDLNKK